VSSFKSEGLAAQHSLLMRKRCLVI
jgi:hypothetical protein